MNGVDEDLEKVRFTDLPPSAYIVLHHADLLQDLSCTEEDRERRRKAEQRNAQMAFEVPHSIVYGRSELMRR